MIVHFKHFNLDLSKPIPEDLNTFSLNEAETVDLIKKWLAGDSSFEFKTSGSTSTPKSIIIKRKYLINSAKRTLDFFSITNGVILNCLSVNHIGGAMQVIRALVCQLDLQILEPRKNPFSEYTIDWQKISLLSLVPYQLFGLIDEYKPQLEQCRVILLGGAAPDSKLIKQCKKESLTNIYETYGMTETLSHVAVKNLITDKYFKGLEGVSFSYGLNNTLTIDDNKLELENLKTNDCIELITNTSFIFLGRNDNVINSGGIKLHPERIEKKYSPYIAGNFIIFSQPHEVFGETLCLLIEGETVIKNLKELLVNDPDISAYEVPKSIFYLKNFIYTATKKINRVLTLSKLKSTNI